MSKGLADQAAPERIHRALLHRFSLSEGSAGRANGREYTSEHTAYQRRRRQ
jgi:hypothetical protein